MNATQGFTLTPRESALLSGALEHRMMEVRAAGDWDLLTELAALYSTIQAQRND